jgi:membrane protein DedA with SNARE-associated domain
MGAGSPAVVQIFLAHFGHAALFALLVLGGLGVPVPEELLQLTGGYLARRAVLMFWPTLVAAWAGIVLGDVLFFLLARRHGPRLLARPSVSRLLTSRRQALLERHFARHATLTIMVARHASALRLPAFALAAVHGVRPLTFLLADGLSALISVPLVVSLGWFFAERIETVRRDLRIAELIVGVVAVGLFIAWLGQRAWRARRAARDRSAERAG